jgi:hypothetical protein
LLVFLDTAEVVAAEVCCAFGGITQPAGGRRWPESNTLIGA